MTLLRIHSIVIALVPILIVLMVVMKNRQNKK